MQMTMNMATGSSKSTCGSVLGALVVVLVAVMAAETSAQLVNMNVTYVNEMDEPITVSVNATALSSSVNTTIAARSDGIQQLSASSTLLASTFTVQVGKCVYATAGSLQGRVTANTGTVKIYLTGHCGTGMAGLQFLISIEGDVIADFGCAAPADPSCKSFICTSPIS